MGPTLGIRPLLVNLMPLAGGVNARAISIEHSFQDAITGGIGDICYRHHSQIQPAPVYPLYFIWLELSALNDVVHNIRVLFPLWFWNGSRSDFEGGPNGSHVISHAGNPFGF